MQEGERQGTEFLRGKQIIGHNENVIQPRRAEALDRDVFSERRRLKDGEEGEVLKKVHKGWISSKILVFFIDKRIKLVEDQVRIIGQTYINMIQVTVYFYK